MAFQNRVDSTHRDVFDRAKKLGAVVVEVPTTRRAQDKGNPDGFVWFSHAHGWIAVQVKGPKTRITETQQKLAAKAPVWTIRDADEMERLIRGRM